MVQVEFDELDEININININYIYIYTLLSRKINHKMMMPHNLIWMDEKFT